MPISGFWHAAAALSGRIDLSLALKASQELSTMSDRALSRCGISQRHITRLRRAPPLHTHPTALTLDDTAYPDALRDLPFAPPVLFYAGNLEHLRDPCVAIVGARRCTQRARDIAENFARSLAAEQVSIVSGLAYGVDEAAHVAAPERAIAVLGQGLGGRLTGRQSRLIELICESGGLILSEFLPGYPAARHTFPQRNRIIAGLAVGTVVVEATPRSGSLVTARHALEYGREVMAVPGHPLDPMSEGCNRLIQDGAYLVTRGQDILDTLAIASSTRSTPVPACPYQQAVLRALQTGDTVDHIAVMSGLDVSTILVAIDDLELTGHVARLPGERLRPSESP